MQARVWPLESSQGPVRLLEISKMYGRALNQAKQGSLDLFGGQYKQFVEWV